MRQMHCQLVQADPAAKRLAADGALSAEPANCGRGNKQNQANNGQPKQSLNDESQH